MTTLTVLRFPDPRLKTKAKPVDEITDDMQTKSKVNYSPQEIEEGLDKVDEKETRIEED